MNPEVGLCFSISATAGPNLAPPDSNRTEQHPSCSAGWIFSFYADGAATIWGVLAGGSWCNLNVRANDAMVNRSASQPSLAVSMVLPFNTKLLTSQKWTSAQIDGLKLPLSSRQQFVDIYNSLF